MTNSIHNTSKIISAKRASLVGQHSYGNLYDIKNEELLTNLEKSTEAMKKAVEVAGMHILSMQKYKFNNQGQGVSIVALLQESHSAIHTWPEYNYATIDIYSCGPNADTEKAFDFLVKELQPDRLEHFYVDRGRIDDAQLRCATPGIAGKEKAQLNVSNE